MKVQFTVPAEAFLSREEVVGTTQLSDMYVYQLGPNDYFEGFVPIREMIRQAVAHEPDHEEYVCPCYWDLERLVAFLASGLQAIGRHTYWEGDVRSGLFMSELPRGDECEPWSILTVKQSNNGSTFVASPVELPWLKAWETHSP